MIFSRSSKGTHIAPLENNDIHVHLRRLYFQSFRTQVISHNVGHFVASHFSSSGRRQEELYRGGSLRRPSVRPSVHLSVCLSV